MPWTVEERRFYSGTAPELARQLGRVADALETIIETPLEAVLKLEELPKSFPKDSDPDDASETSMGIEATKAEDIMDAIGIKIFDLADMLENASYTPEQVEWSRKVANKLRGALDFPDD